MLKLNWGMRINNIGPRKWFLLVNYQQVLVLCKNGNIDMGYRYCTDCDRNSDCKNLGRREISIIKRVGKLKMQAEC